MTRPEPAPTENEESKPVSRAIEVRRSGFVSRWLVRLGLFLCLLAITVGGVCWYVYRAAQVVPDYYQALLEQPETEMDEAGDQFETELLELQNSAIELGNWQAAFSQDQINGWLSTDLPQKFPDTLPPTITNPRVSLKKDELMILFRFDSPKLSGIVECSGDLFCTEEVNQVAVRIKYIRSGVLSLPITKWTDDITKIFKSKGLETQWVEDNGDPMVLVNLASRVSNDSDQTIVIESLEILKGKVVLQGVTVEPEDKKAYDQARLSIPLNTRLDR